MIKAPPRFRCSVPLPSSQGSRLTATVPHLTLSAQEGRKDIHVRSSPYESIAGQRRLGPRLWRCEEGTRLLREVLQCRRHFVLDEAADEKYDLLLNVALCRLLDQRDNLVISRLCLPKCIVTLPTLTVFLTTFAPTAIGVQEELRFQVEASADLVYRSIEYRPRRWMRACLTRGKGTPEPMLQGVIVLFPMRALCRWTRVQLQAIAYRPYGRHRVALCIACCVMSKILL